MQICFEAQTIQGVLNKCEMSDSRAALALGNALIKCIENGILFFGETLDVNCTRFIADEIAAESLESDVNEERVQEAAGLLENERLELTKDLYIPPDPLTQKPKRGRPKKKTFHQQLKERIAMHNDPDYGKPKRRAGRPRKGA